MNRRPHFPLSIRTPCARLVCALTGSVVLALASPAQAHDAAHHADPHASHGTASRPVSSDADSVRAVLMKTWDQPQSRLVVDPIVVQGDVALAGWQQGERGGRALLRRHGSDNGWRVAICAGDGLRDPSLLRDAGVPAADADLLARRLADAESRLDARTQARFASFDGLVRMDGQGNHPPGHGTAPDPHAGHGTAHDTPGVPHGQH